MNRRPLVAVTVGDPAGIGPEIVVKALGNPETFLSTRPLVVGDRWILQAALQACGLNLEIEQVSHATGGKYTPGKLDLIDVGSAEAGSVRAGSVQAAAGKAAYDYLVRAVELASAGEVDAIATAPINKEALRVAGVPFLDHTEALASLTQSPHPLTIFVVGNLRIFFLTRHLSLMQACGQITRSRVLDGILQVDATLKRYGLPEARIAVAGLNPHAGEGGMFGDEEIIQIAPAVGEARGRGIDVWGPVPADAVFHLAHIGRFDAVLSLYHDQGHIAAKTLDFERTVSITAGLPFVRSSVDHGTAFDIAGRGIASPISMQEAIKAAGDYALRLKK